MSKTFLLNHTMPKTTVAPSHKKANLLGNPINRIPNKNSITILLIQYALSTIFFLFIILPFNCYPKLFCTIPDKSLYISVKRNMDLTTFDILLHIDHMKNPFLVHQKYTLPDFQDLHFQNSIPNDSV